MEGDFVSWLNRELQIRDWSQRELARRAGLSQTTVSQVLAYQRNPTPDFCIDVARALRLPPESMLRRAGHLAPAPQTPLTDIPRLQEFVTRLQRLPLDSQNLVMQTALMLLEMNERDDADATDAPAILPGTPHPDTDDG